MSDTKPLSARIPSDAWDSHMHIVDPDNYPLAADAHYRPTPHRLSDAFDFYSTIGIHKMVLVQPSIYGNDNSCMLDALRTLGPHRGRAVVTFDPETIKTQTLQEWHQLGVRGARVNLQSVGKTLEAKELADILRKYADVIRPWDWVLQLYIPLRMADDLKTIVPELKIKVCLDHFGHPSLPDPETKPAASSGALDPYTLPGFDSLINLLVQGNTFVKLSAAYRISKLQDQSDIDPIAKEILRVAGKTRAVFATDWPHTRFEGLDIKPYMETVLRWCGDDDSLRDRIFRGNAEDLWGLNQ